MTISLWNTYYYVPLQSDYSGDNDTNVYDMSGNVIATVPAAFMANMCVEGTGKLTDGTILNTAGSCSYGPTCPTGGQQCYTILDPGRYPWGVGVRGRPLVPLQSIAVDPATIPIGSNVYIAEFDGAQIPAIDGIGGFTHNGCFVADDQGGWIQGNHIDIFAGTRGMYRALEALHPTHSTLTATIGSCTPGGSGGSVLNVLTNPANQTNVVIGLLAVTVFAVGSYYAFEAYQRGDLQRFAQNTFGVRGQAGAQANPRRRRRYA